MAVFEKCLFQQLGYKATTQNKHREWFMVAAEFKRVHLILETIVDEASHICCTRFEYYSMSPLHGVFVAWGSVMVSVVCDKTVIREGGNVMCRADINMFRSD